MTLLCVCPQTLSPCVRVWPARLDDDDDYDEEYDDTKIEKSRMRGFARGKLEAGRNELGYVQLDI